MPTKPLKASIVRYKPRRISIIFSIRSEKKVLSSVPTMIPTMKAMYEWASHLKFVPVMGTTA
jgi:hypothetical protein